MGVESKTDAGLVFDMHSDLVTDLARRRAAGETHVFERRHYHRLWNSGVRALIAVLWVEPEYRGQSAQRFMQLLGSLLSELDECSANLALVEDVPSLKRVNAAGQIGIFLGVEGMTFVEQWPLLESAAEDHSEVRLDERFRETFALLKRVGLRHAILAWGERNRIASGPGGPPRDNAATGLTDFGRRVIQKLAKSNVLVDVSHLDDQSIDDVLDTLDGPILASHSNARALCDVPRNLLDRHIREIASRGGLIGLNSYARFVHDSAPSIDRFIDHAVYIADLVGPEHVALGFDFTDYLPSSSGFGPPHNYDLQRVEDVPRLYQRLLERGFTRRETHQIAFENGLRMIDAATTQEVLMGRATH